MRDQSKQHNWVWVQYQRVTDGRTGRQTDGKARWETSWSQSIKFTIQNIK